ncbi:MAG: hypothetical protein OSB62_07580 [Alphaproteobacteria bacterium]|nr:hypothetical protein [Alphaproteobacteria bacterium]
MSMTNKASRTPNHVRFNKHAAPVPKKRKKTAKKEEALSPYVSDLSKTPSLKRADKLKFRKTIWIFAVIFILAGLDQFVPSVRKTFESIVSESPEFMPEVSSLVQKAGNLMSNLNRKQTAVLLMDTVGYDVPSHLEDPSIHLVSGMDLEVVELRGQWAQVSSPSVDFIFWVDKNTLLLEK